MSDQPTSPDMPSAISSEAFQAGRLPSNSRAGRTITLAGRVRARVSRFLRRESEQESQIAGIYGLSSSGSLRPAARRSSSASKSHPQKLSVLSLRLLSLSRFKKARSPEQTDSQNDLLQARVSTSIPAGSMEYEQTWKRKVTPSGLWYWEHTASARPTSGSGCTGWPTPNAGPQNDTDTQWEARRAICKERHGNNGFGLTLGMASQLSGWPSPQVHDVTTRGNTEADHHHFPHDLSNAAELAGWSTPRLEDGESAGMRHSRGVADTLSAQVGQDLAGWATPAARDIKSESATDEFNEKRWNHTRGKPLSAEATQALGPTASSSPAATGKCGVLAGAFALWLQGFPATWQCSCPGWQSWDTIQRLLAKSSEKPDDTE